MVSGLQSPQLIPLPSSGPSKNLKLEPLRAHKLEELSGAPAVPSLDRIGSMFMVNEDPDGPNDKLLQQSTSQSAPGVVPLTS